MHKTLSMYKADQNLLLWLYPSKQRKKRTWSKM